MWTEDLPLPISRGVLPQPRPLGLPRQPLVDTEGVLLRVDAYAIFNCT